METIHVKPCDLAILLYLVVKQGKRYVQVVKSFDRDKLQSRGWSIYMTRKLWEACLKDKLIRDLSLDPSR
jgi:hypothetical protein